MKLKEAIKILIEDDVEHIEDFLFEIKERAKIEEGFQDDPWNHPRVMRFNNAVKRLKEELRTGRFN